MAMPEYTAQSSIATGSTGPHADASELNPFNEQSAAAVAGGLQSSAKLADMYDQKTDAMWAFNQSVQLQGQWKEQVGGYTDPDQFQKDYTQSQQDIMKNAPSGRASDAFIKQTDQFGNHMVGTVIHQKVAQDRATAAQQLKEANAKLQEEATEAGMDVKAQRAKAQAGLDLAKGIVPDSVLMSMKTDMAVALDKTEISNTANSLGSATAADKMAEGTLGTNLQPAEKSALQNGYSLQGETDLAVAKVKAQESFNNQLHLIESGQILGTTPIQDAALARMMAYANTNLKSETIHNADGTHQKTQYLDEEQFNGHMQTFTQKIADAKMEGVMRTQMIGMDNTQSDDFLRSVQTKFGLGSKQDVTAKKIQDQFDSQKAKDPFQFTFNSPVFTQKYNNALNMITQAEDSKDPQMIETAKSNFKDTLTAALAIQSKSGVPEEQQAVMTKAEASQYAANIMQGGVDGADKSFKTMQDRYGDYFPQAFRQLQSDKMPAGQRVPAYYAALEEHSDNPVVHQTLISAMQAENPPAGKGFSLDKQIEQKGDKELPSKLMKATTAAMKPYTDALSLNSSGANYSSEMNQAVTSYAKQVYLVNPNISPEEAAAKAANAVIYSQYDTHQINGRSMLIPRTDGSGNSYGQEEIDRIKDNLNYQHYMIASGRQDIGIDPSQFYSSRVPATQAEFQRDLYTKGQWVLTPDKKNFQMVMNVGDAKVASETGLQTNPSGNSVKYLYNKAGQPVQIPVASLNQPMGWTDWAKRKAELGKDYTEDAAVTAGGVIADTAVGTGKILGKVGGIVQKGAEAMAEKSVPVLL